MSTMRYVEKEGSRFVKVLTFARSWLGSNLLGLTVCRVLGHRRPEPEEEAFLWHLADLYQHPPESDVWDIICVRCGSTIGRMPYNGDST